MTQNTPLHQTTDNGPVINLTRAKRVRFTYTNWRGELSQRHVELYGAFWGATKWHPEPQWFVNGFDLDKREHRDFAMRDMIGVENG